MDAQPCFIGLALVILIIEITGPIWSRMGLGQLPGASCSSDGFTSYSSLYAQSALVTCILIAIIPGSLICPLSR